MLDALQPFIPVTTLSPKASEKKPRDPTKALCHHDPYGCRASLEREDGTEIGRVGEDKIRISCHSSDARRPFPGRQWSVQTWGKFLESY